MSLVSYGIGIILSVSVSYRIVKKVKGTHPYITTSAACTVQTGSSTIISHNSNILVILSEKQCTIFYIRICPTLGKNIHVLGYVIFMLLIK